MATDPRGLQGIMSRGRNVYRGGSSAAHMGGGPQFGRPPSVPTALLRQVMLARLLKNAGDVPQQQPVSPALDPGASPMAQMQAAAARRVDVPQPSMPRPPAAAKPRATPPGLGGVVPPGHALKRIEFHPPTEMANAAGAIQQMQQQAQQQVQQPQPWFQDAAQKFQQMQQQIPQRAPTQMRAAVMPNMQALAQRRVLGA